MSRSNVAAIRRIALNIVRLMDDKHSLEDQLHSLNE